MSYDFSLSICILYRNTHNGSPKGEERTFEDIMLERYSMKTLMKREEGGGFRMGNTCIPVADSF